MPSVAAESKSRSSGRSGAERCLLGACQEKEQNAVRSRLTGKQGERSRKHSDSQSQSRTLGQRCSGAVVQVKQGSGGGRGGGGRRCRLDTQELSVLTSLIYSVVMVLLLISIAPSATIMIFSLFIPARFYRGWGGWWRENMTEKTETFRSMANQTGTDSFVVKGCGVLFVFFPDLIDGSMGRTMMIPHPSASPCFWLPPLSLAQTRGYSLP